MICAVASGKGGTGKTTVAASLAAVWDRPLCVADLDVEEPNLHLFLDPTLEAEEPALLEIPVLDPARCTLCGLCAEFCQFKALALMGKTLRLFPEMCHGCGGCLRLCPEAALTPGGRELGGILSGRAGGADFLMGRLRVGEAMTPPLLRVVKARLPEDGRDVILDAPPGVSCPAVNAVRDADVVVLVTEPTPFGLHDLRLAVEAFRPLGMALGVAVNRAGIGDDGVAEFCRGQGLPIWAEIPFSRRAAEAYAHGEVLAEALPELRPVFLALAERIRAAAQGPAEAAEARHA